MVKFNQKRAELYKKLTIFTLLFIILSFFCSCFTFSDAHFSEAASGGSAAIVIEQNSERVLYADNENAQLPIASTTKILTALCIIENIENLNENIVIPSEAEGVEGSSIYLRAGEKMSYIDLLYGLMLRSGNDAAVALAIACSGNVENFAALMNKTAKKCGANNSNFVNPHGLNDENHYSTAHDLALICAKAFRRDVFRKIVSSEKYVAQSGSVAREFFNKNKMLSLYDGANGVKTGYTKTAGRCLVSSAARGGMQLICVVLNHGDMWNDSMNLMSEAFEVYKMHCFGGEFVTVPVKKGNCEVAVLKFGKTFSYPLSESETYNIETEYVLPDYLSAPVKEGEFVGKYRVYCRKRLLFETNLYTIQDIKRKVF